MPDTRTLLERARIGDADAFCELSRLHGTRLLRQAITLCGNESMAEDLAQDTLVEAWKCLHRYNQRCQFFTWLCAILLNRYRNTLRKQRTAPQFMGLETNRHELPDFVTGLADPELLPDEAVQQRERAELVHGCLQSLSQKHKEVIYLRFYVDDSLEGIAAALGCSLGTVKSRLFHALDKLRGMKALREHPNHPEAKAGLL